MQCIVKAGNARLEIPRLFVQLADIIVNALAQALKIAFFCADVQSFPHLLVKVGKIGIAHRRAHGLHSKLLKTVFCCAFKDCARPFLYPLTGQPDALTLAKLHTGQHRLLFCRIPGNNLNRVQFPGRCPKALHGGKGRSQVLPKAFNA